MENFTKIECCKCGVVFAVSYELNRNWKKTNCTFYCPNGHGQSYTEVLSDLLQKKLAQKAQLVEDMNERITELLREDLKMKKKLARIKSKAIIKRK